MIKDATPDLPSTDIVERLRHGIADRGAESLMDEAADEIERLRAALRAVADYVPGGDHQAVLEAVRRALGAKAMTDTETLCKLYLELANVVPTNCISSREIAAQKRFDKYGIALMMISEGCADPSDVARRALEPKP